MIKRFFDGLIFGAGFSIALVLIWFIGLNYLMQGSVFQEPTFTQSEAVENSEVQNRVKFHELSDEDQIKNASVLVVTKYLPGSDGKTLAVIEEIHKKSQDTIFYFEIGDEYPSASFYPEETSRGEGAAILFIGSPAEERMSISIFSKRIGAYGNMPVKTLISKFNDKDI